MTISSIRKLLDNNSGANLVEYIILVGVVALLSIAAFTMFGDSVRSKVEEEGEKVQTIATE